MAWRQLETVTIAGPTLATLVGAVGLAVPYTPQEGTNCRVTLVMYHSGADPDPAADLRTTADGGASAKRIPAGQTLAQVDLTGQWALDLRLNVPAGVSVVVTADIAGHWVGPLV